MRVAVVERRDLPMVVIDIVIAAGAELDAPRQAGRISMTAEMLDEGTPTRAALDIAEQLDFLGASVDIQPGWDATVVSLQVLSSRLEAALDIVADAILNATFPEAEYRRKHKEQLSALLQERDEASLLAGKALAAGVFGPEHPYGAPIGGTEAALLQLTRNDVESVYRDRFSPANTFIVVVGDVAASEIAVALEKRFGAWLGSANAPRRSAPPNRTVRRVLLVNKPQAAQAELRVGHAAPPRTTPDFFALIVLNTILGGSFTSRLNTILRERMGVTYGARSGFRLRRAGGLFGAGAAVFTEAAARSAQVVIEEMTRLAESRVPADELQRAQSYIALGLPRSFETTEDIAAHLREQILYDLPADYWQSYVDHIFAVTADDIIDTAARHLQPDSCVITVVADQNDVGAALEHAALGDVVVTSVPT